MREDEVGGALASGLAATPAKLECEESALRGGFVRPCSKAAVYFCPAPGCGRKLCSSHSRNQPHCSRLYPDGKGHYEIREWRPERIA